MEKSKYQSFLAKHQLPESYPSQATEHYRGVIDDVLGLTEQQRPAILGINGCQGSGKTTLAAFIQTVLEAEHQLRVVSISLDDFYLSKERRLQLAQDISPLLQTRGVPGTHDVALAIATLKSLQDSSNNALVAIPRFDKSADDIFPTANWDNVCTPVDVIILEGWCLGARGQADNELRNAINPLEQHEDSDCIWREYVNKQLQQNYPGLFGFVDMWVMLRAPSFQAVYHWRLEQEEKLAKKLLMELDNESGVRKPEPRYSGLMNAEQILRFVQYFQRLTEAMLEDMPDWVDHVYQLDNGRRIIDEKHRKKENSG